MCEHDITSTRTTMRMHNPAWLHCTGCDNLVELKSAPLRPQAKPGEFDWERMGKCCYGGFKLKRDCASCAAWVRL